MGKYQTAPPKISGIPKGIPFIVGNEAAERFSFYGMKAILVVFMTQYLMNREGQLAVMNDSDAKAWFHLFVSAVYFLPIAGAILADAFLGKYLTIVSLSIVYCFGHLALALDDTRLGLSIGLTLIAIGSGGIKPCVTAHVGDQFGSTNSHLLPKVYSWFYFSINFGSFFSTLLTPYLLENKIPIEIPGIGVVMIGGANFAFGVPGLLMFLATFIFWLGRRKYVHIPPGGKEFVRQSLDRESLIGAARLWSIFIFVSIFWSLYDQSSGAWVLQARKMNLEFLGMTLLPSQVQAVNPLLVLIYIPLFAYVLYPAINKVFVLTPLRKMSIGFFLTVPSFLLSAWIEQRIIAGETPSIGWQILAYIILTAAEILISITGLEFSYTQAPTKMKSLIMSFWLLTSSLGNAFTAAINFLIGGEKPLFKLEGANYYLFFAGLMGVAAVLFIWVALRYKEKTHLQDEA